MSKSVEYLPDRCEVCTAFHKANETTTVCRFEPPNILYPATTSLGQQMLSFVQPPVNPSGWCRQFQRKMG